MKKLIYLTAILVLLFPFLSSAQTNYEDVVYLKNGSIIRGTIVEQIPHQSIKIETRDSNVFTFKTDEIEKMTKESKTTAKNSIYVMWVTMKSGEKLKGKIIRKTMDSLTIVDAWSLRPIHVNQIKSIRTRRRNAGGMGAAIGIGIGSTLGAIIAAVSYSNSEPECMADCDLLSPSEENALMGAVLGGMAGMVVGVMIGSQSKEFKIEGNQNQFDLFANKYWDKVFK